MSREYIRVYTESPRETLWTYWRRFEVAESVGEIAHSAKAKNNAEAIGHCVRQAREYFSSAGNAQPLTRPVLLYYGMVSLAKLILLMDSENPLSMEEIEDAERHGHGLRQHDPPSSGGSYLLEEGEIEVTA
ncbi:MAG TPA: YaaC family protein, partial [Chloroflexota bacterium]|nr:YaaC family protein [Chloroflexota bacterium]